jgi:hypothetical protein
MDDEYRRRGAAYRAVYPGAHESIVHNFASGKLALSVDDYTLLQRVTSAIAAAEGAGREPGSATDVRMREERDHYREKKMAAEQQLASALDDIRQLQLRDIEREAQLNKLQNYVGQIAEALGTPDQCEVLERAHTVVEKVASTAIKNARLEDQLRVLTRLEAQLHVLTDERETVAALVKEHGSLVRGILIDQCNSARRSLQLSREMSLVSAMTLWQRLMDAEREAHRFNPSEKEESNELGNNRSGVGQGPRQLDADEASGRSDDAQAGERGGADGAVRSAERGSEGPGSRNSQDGAASGSGAGAAEVATCDDARVDASACYCSDGMSGGVPCPPGKCPNVPGAVLSPKEWEEFQAMLAEPPRVIPELVAALRNRRVARTVQVTQRVRDEHPGVDDDAGRQPQTEYLTLKKLLWALDETSGTTGSGGVGHYMLRILADKLRSGEGP